MNLCYYFYRVASAIKFHSSKMFYKYIQKPLWMISYGGGNCIKINGLMLNCTFIIDGENNKVIIEEGCYLNGVHIKITGNNHTLILGSSVSFNEGGRIIIEDEGNALVIGERTKIYSSFITLRDMRTILEIGKNCLFSANVTIRTSDAHTIIDATGQRINNGKSVKIGNHVWIGYNATILKGCNIGENSIVGTNCVVGNQTVPANTIIGGNPARILKTGIDWDIKRL